MDKIYYKKRIKKAINMEEKLTLEHLAAYLPYGLKCNCMGGYIDDYEDTPVPIVFKMIGLLNKNRVSLTYLCEKNVFDIDEVFPLLHPLSKLTKEIEHNGEKFVMMDKLYEISDCEADDEYLEALNDISPNYEQRIRFAPYRIMIEMIKYHFDVFGLIEKELAIEKQ